LWFPIRQMAKQVLAGNRDPTGLLGPKRLDMLRQLAPAAATVAMLVGTDTLEARIERRDVPVAGLVAYPLILVSHPSFPAQTVPDLIAYTKSNPGKVTMASFGIAPPRI
jgi:tripartite-type tricarboxylate transporter receptor subunit TctC